MALLNEADKIYVGSALVTAVYLGTTLIWPSGQTVSAMQLSAIFGALQVVSRR